MQTLRSWVFYLGYSAATIFWGTLGTLFGWLLPFRSRFQFIVVYWTRFCLWWLRVTCGVRHRVHGLENLPQVPCIVLCRHESTWETLFLQTIFVPQSTLIKKELLRIPFFGWAFRTLRPIAIDRSAPRAALRRLIQDGKERLNSGIWVVMFPEGTRMPRDTLGRFQPGGAALAAATGYPIVLVGHNAGSHWPAHATRKYPGEIQVHISHPLTTEGKTSKQIQQEVTSAFEKLMAKLPSDVQVDHR